MIGCLDPRVDPVAVLGARPGELAVIRNVGGRVTPEVIKQLVILRAVAQAAGADLGTGWELVVLQHTECGIAGIADRPDLLSDYLGVGEPDLGAASVSDPVGAVARDVAALRTMSGLGEGVEVSGMVYDVATGRVQSVADAS